MKLKFKSVINKANGQTHYSWPKKQISISPKEFTLDINKRKGTIKGGKIKWN